MSKRFVRLWLQIGSRRPDSNRGPLQSIDDVADFGLAPSASSRTFWARIGHCPKRPLPATLCADSVLGLESCGDAWASRLPNLDVELELCPKLWRSPLSPEIDADRVVVAFHGRKPHPLEEANEVVYQRRMADSNSHGRRMLPRLILVLEPPRGDWPEVQT
jgi:hypothetical protein